MQPARFRLTIRRLMILVALSAFVPMTILGWRWWTLHDNYRMAAQYEAEEQAERRTQVDGMASLRARGLDKDNELFPIIEELAKRRLDYHTAMRAKYEWAANHPWEAAPTDAGEPFDDRLTVQGPGPISRLDSEIPKFAVVGEPAQPKPQPE